MSQKFFILIIAVLSSAFICGCNSVAEPIAVKDIKVLNQRVKLTVPEDWKRLKETIGSTHTVYYSMTNPNPEAEKSDGVIVVKYQNCDEQLTLDMYREFVLRNNDFSEQSENIILKDTREEKWHYLKWQGEAKDKTYIIWDILGVDGDVAGHIRATCPVNGQSKKLQQIMNNQMETIFGSIEVTPKEDDSEDDSEEDAADNAEPTIE